MLSSFRPRSENPPPTKSCHLSPLPSSSSVGIPTSLLAPSGLIPSRRPRRWNCTWIRDKTESPSQTNPGLVFIQIPHNAHCSPMIGIKLLATARRRLWLCKPLVRDQLSVFKAVVSGGGGAEREAEGKRKSFSIIGVERPAAPHIGAQLLWLLLLQWQDSATCACPALAPNCAAKAVMQGSLARSPFWESHYSYLTDKNAWADSQSSLFWYHQASFNSRPISYFNDAVIFSQLFCPSVQHVPSGCCWHKLLRGLFRPTWGSGRWPDQIVLGKTPRIEGEGQ